MTVALIRCSVSQSTSAASAALGKRPQRGAVNDLGIPLACFVRFDMAGPRDRELTQRSEINFVGINRRYDATGCNIQFHYDCSRWLGRIIERRGRSTISPSSVAWTPANCDAIC